jgi:hypothetical protein
MAALDLSLEGGNVLFRNGGEVAFARIYGRKSAHFALHPDAMLRT